MFGFEEFDDDSISDPNFEKNQQESDDEDEESYYSPSMILPTTGQKFSLKLNFKPHLLLGF